MAFINGRSVDSPLALNIPHFNTNSSVFRILVLKLKGLCNQMYMHGSCFIVCLCT